MAPIYVLLAIFFIFCVVRMNISSPPSSLPKLIHPWVYSKLVLPLSAMIKPKPAAEPKDRIEVASAGSGEEAAGGRKAENGGGLLEAVFSTFDHNKDGYIALPELVDSFERLGRPVSVVEAIGMMQKVDANEDGLIDMDEFQQLYATLGLSEEREQERDMRDVFEVFDEDGDGKISEVELAAVLKSLGLVGNGETAAAKCREMIKKVDMDGDGMVNFEEFRSMMTSSS